MNQGRGETCLFGYRYVLLFTAMNFSSRLHSSVPRTIPRLDLRPCVVHAEGESLFIPLIIIFSTTIAFFVDASSIANVCNHVSLNPCNAGYLLSIRFDSTISLQVRFDLNTP